MDIAEIKLLVTDAFKGVVLGDRYSLRDMEEMDNWGERGSDKDLLAFPDVETKDDWAALSVETLDRYAGLAHVDAAGFRYFIPAFMLSILAEYEPSEMRFICTLSALYPRRDGLSEYTISRYALLKKTALCYRVLSPKVLKGRYGIIGMSFCRVAKQIKRKDFMQDEPQHHTRGLVAISTDRAKLDLEATLHLLHMTHWGATMTLQVLERAVANSVCFGMYTQGRQIGFGRVVSDLATYAYLTDFVIAEEYQGQGLGKWLVECVLAHPDFQHLRRVALVTKNAKKLYEPFGFTEGSGSLVYMERRGTK